MSISRSSHKSPRYSDASHGRIVTQNSSLSSALLRENTDGIVAPNSRKTSVVVDHTALDVVSSRNSSRVNVSNVTNTVSNNENVQYVVISKSRQSLNTAATNSEALLSDNYRSQTERKSNADLLETNSNKDTHLLNDQVIEDSSRSVGPELEKVHESGDVNNKYAYHSLKSSRQASRSNSQAVGLINYNNQQSSQPGFKGEGADIDKLGDQLKDNSSAFNDKSNPAVVNAFGNGESEVDANASTNNNSLNVNSRSQSNAHLKDRNQAEVEVAALAGNRSESGTQDNFASARENSLYQHQHQHTRLSLNSQHDRVSRNREPANVDVTEQAVPPLDLSELDKNKSPISDPVLPSDTDSSPTSRALHSNLQVPDQNLHASGINNSLVHFSPHDFNPTNRTYEVDSPAISSKLPHVKSSDNFRGQADTYRQDDQDTFRDREQGPERLDANPSDLADDLNVPYQFDTQAQFGYNNNFEKPPSPPVQTTPPPEKQPATSLRSNSNVYAVANPEVLRAQGISPPPGTQFTPRQYSNAQSRHSRQQEVQFESRAEQRQGSQRENFVGSPVKDRAPTPYAAPPKEDSLASQEEYPRSPPNWEDKTEEQRRSSQSKPNSRRGSSKQGLPPQHPPLDTKHSSSKPGSVSTARREREGSVKRVYVESPSFTREEEDEYRFVNSRLDDIEEKETFREMDKRRGPGYGGDDYERAGRVEYERRSRDANDRNRKDENDRNRREENDRNRREENYRRQQEQNRGNQDRYDSRNTDRNRYEDRNHEMNGYSDQRDDQQERHNRDRYEDRNKYVRDNESYDKQEQYRRLQGDRVEYENEPHREEEPDFRRSYKKQNTEVVDELDLRKEAEYQRDLKRRIDKQKQKLKNAELSQSHRESYGRENNYERDSLDYADEKDTARSYAKDSLEFNNHVEQNREWANPPQNPYQENQGQYPRGEYAQASYGQGNYENQDTKPDFYDEEDAENMEIVHPKPPRYDYVELNKQDYGKPPPKSYRTIVHKKKEEEQKLDHIFITPKVPSKHAKHKQTKKAQSAQPEHMGYQPPVQDQYPMGFKPSSAEEVWAKRSAFLSMKKSSANSSKKGGSANKAAPKWNSNPRVKQNYKYEAPPSLPTSGQGFKPPPNMSYSTHQGGGGYNPQEQGGYTTPTRHLQPIENKPAPPTSTELVPTAVNPASPFRRHMELKPISQEILTEDGQRISVDINLRLISPPPGQSGSGSPQQQQLALVPVQETQGQPMDDGNQLRGVGVPYQMQDQYGNYDNGYTTGYQEDPQYEEYHPVDNIQDIETRIHNEEAALNEHGSYAKKYIPGTVNFKDDGTASVDLKTLEEGYAAIYNKMKTKDHNEHPWYKVYNLNDYKKMQREVRLNRGTLGPDLDTEPYKEKMEKRHKQFEYARMVMEKNRMELQSKKPPQFPRSPPKIGEENVKRKAAIEYSKNIPKPSVKPRPNQYNSYEVSAQIAPGGPGHLKPRGSPSMNKNSSPSPSQTVDVIDIRSLQQRHLQERKTADKISRNMDSVLSQKAH